MQATMELEANSEATFDGDRLRAARQAVLGDVSCVLAKACGAEDISPRAAQQAARNLCDILFSHPQSRGTEIPKLFWETPLGHAVERCFQSSAD
ncbi:MAG TPA: hypothetical protein VM490_14310 [Armatimonadaceae bacterium]|nr:hypothetical protein [Armatimonadaceae bacterium]